MVDAEYAYAGVKVRVFGRNMQVSGHSPSAWFVDSQNNTIAASVLSSESTPYYLALTAPSLAQGVNYRVKVNNGLGGSFGDAFSDDVVRGASVSSDPWGLDVFWAGEFAQIASRTFNVRDYGAQGSGLVNEIPAFNAAIAAASAAGGGTVYVPTGDYLIRSGIWLPSNVVLKGDGPLLTKVNYNISNCCDGAITFRNGATRVGAMDLSLINVNYSEAPDRGDALEHSIRTDSGGGCQTPYCSVYASKIILKNLYINALSSKSMNFVNSDYLLLSGVNYRYPGRRWYPIWGLYGKYLTVRGNTFDREAGRILFTDFKYAVFDGNTFILNNSIRKNDRTETGGLEFSFDPGAAIINNRIQNIGERPQNDDQFRNDGEEFMTQQAREDTEQIQDYGTATGGGATYLTDSTKNWVGKTGFNSRTAVTILSGQGAGQVRIVTSRSNSQLTVDKPWDIPPAAGSFYTLVPYSAYQNIIYNNQLSNVMLPLYLYNGAYDVVYASNTLAETGPIIMRSPAIDATSFNDPLRNPFFYQPVMRNYLADNSITNTNGKYCAVMQLALNEYFRQWNENQVLGNEVRRNYLQTVYVDPNYVSNRAYAECGQSGSTYQNGDERRQGYRLNYALQGYYSGDLNFNILGMRGNIFQGNRDVNNGVGYDLYNLDPVAGQTVLERG
jgi:hypothetical protein